MDAEEKQEMLRIAPALLMDMPVLTVKIGISYMKTKRRMRKAVKSFRKGIAGEGLPPEVAESLTSVYDEGTSLFRQFAGSLIRGLPIQPK